MEPCCFILHLHIEFFPLLISLPQTRVSALKLEALHPFWLWTNQDVWSPCDFLPNILTEVIVLGSAFEETLTRYMSNIREKVLLLTELESVEILGI